MRGDMVMVIDFSRRVMAGLVPATHDFPSTAFRKTWVAGPSPAMTRGLTQGLLP
jgi:hypothetical protein